MHSAKGYQASHIMLVVKNPKCYEDNKNGKCKLYLESKVSQHVVVSYAIVSDSCDPMCCSSPGSSVRGILQARIMQWVAVSYSRGSSQSRD